MRNTMHHEDASLLIVDYARGILHGEDHAGMSSHVASCDECQRVLGVIEAIAAPAAHPSSEEIVAFAAGNPSFDPGTAERLESHLDSCGACAQEVRVTRGAAGARNRWRGQAPSGWMNPAAMAAGIAALLLAYPAWLGIARLPQQRATTKQLDAEMRATRQQAGDLQAQIDQFKKWKGGAASSLHLEIMRGEDVIPSVRLDPSQPFTPLLVEPLLPSTARDTDLYVFEIRNQAGGVIWSAELTAMRIREALGSSAQSVVLIVPTGAISPGLYDLQLLPTGAAPGAALFTLPFQFIR